MPMVTCPVQGPLRQQDCQGIQVGKRFVCRLPPLFLGLANYSGGLPVELPLPIDGSSLFSPRAFADILPDHPAIHSPRPGVIAGIRAGSLVPAHMLPPDRNPGTEQG